MRPGARPNGASAGHDRQSYVKSVQGFRQSSVTLSFSAYNEKLLCNGEWAVDSLSSCAFCNDANGCGEGRNRRAARRLGRESESRCRPYYSGGSFDYVDLPRGRPRSNLRCIVNCRLLYAVRAQVCGRAYRRGVRFVCG